MQTSSAISPSPRQPASVSSARVSTCWPSAPITPVSSAIVMNSLGDTCGQSAGQRASASSPEMPPVARSMIGW